MTGAALPLEAEQFLQKLRVGLRRLPREERDEIVAEIRSHLLDRQASGKPLLEGFGDGQQYAAQFVAEGALRGALIEGSSLALAQALLRGARKGAAAFVVLPVVAVQLFGAALVACGILKPFLPSRIGLFVDGAGAFASLGIVGGDLRALHEVLGFWSIPLFLLAGIALLWGGHRVLEWLASARLRRSR
jgi:uncharacterized membrane protein